MQQFRELATRTAPTLVQDALGVVALAVVLAVLLHLPGVI